MVIKKGNENSDQKPRARRTITQLEQDILEKLRLADEGVCTTELAELIGAGYYVALRRLQKMEFDRKVESFKPGFKERKTYWRIRR